MGAWGTGPFENDDAMDWIAALEDSTDDSPLVAAFDAVLDANGYVEAPEAASALAAAEVVAGALGSPHQSLPPEVTGWIAANSGEVQAATVEKAYRATEKVASDSELLELWNESDSRDEWRQEIVSLQQRLATAPG